jgi:hypothetical protein
VASSVRATICVAAAVAGDDMCAMPLPTRALMCTAAQVPLEHLAAAMGASL